MTPAEAVREKIQITAFPDDLFAENCYVVRRRDTNAVLVIDPGLQIVQVLDRLGAERLEVERILVTHGHIDHVAGVPLLHRETRAPVVMHTADRGILDWEQFAQLPFIPRDFTDFVIDVPVQHESAITFHDLTLRVLHTPGHTEGSVCFVAGLDCFAGDTLFQRSIGRTDLPGGDSQKIATSIRQVLYRLPRKTVVLPGHGPRTTVEEEMLLNPFVPGAV